MNDRGWAIGVDGGGSCARIGLAQVHSDGVSLMDVDCRSAACNATAESFEQVSHRLENALRALWEEHEIEPGQVLAIGMGMSGAGRESVRQPWIRWARERMPNATVWVGTDLELLLPPSRLETPAIALIAGTGSVAAARLRSGNLVRSGGWGTPLGDEGGGYWVALQAFQAICRAYDQRGPETQLADVGCRFLGIDDWREAPLVFMGRTRAQIAQFSQQVTQLAANDEVASHIVDSATIHLSELVHAVRRRAELGHRVAELCMTGGLLNGSSLFRKRLVARLQMSKAFASTRFERFNQTTLSAIEFAIDLRKGE